MEQYPSLAGGSLQCFRTVIKPLWEKVREIIKEDARETTGQGAVVNGHAHTERRRGYQYFRGAKWTVFLTDRLINDCFFS